MNQNHPILPFFMTYPQFSVAENNVSRQDMDYLQQMYPREARAYQRAIVDILDRIDYRGSFLYDEYPDRLGLIRLADIVVQYIPIKNPEMAGTPVNRDLVEVILYWEIYKRRQDWTTSLPKF